MKTKTKLKDKVTKQKRSSFAKGGSSLFIQNNDIANKSKSLSRKDKKIHATMASLTCILEENHHVGEVMSDLAVEAKEWASGTPPSKRMLQKHSRNLKLCQFVLDGTEKVMISAAEVTSPLAGMVQLYKRQQVETKYNDAFKNPCSTFEVHTLIEVRYNVSYLSQRSCYVYIIISNNRIPLI